MSLAGKIWRGAKRGASKARLLLHVAALVGTAFRGVIRGDVGKVLEKAADLNDRVKRVEDALRDGPCKTCGLLPGPGSLGQTIKPNYGLPCPGCGIIAGHRPEKS